MHRCDVGQRNPALGDFCFGAGETARSGKNGWLLSWHREIELFAGARLGAGLGVFGLGPVHASNSYKNLMPMLCYLMVLGQ